MIYRMLVSLVVCIVAGCQQAPDPQLQALQQENQKLKQDQLQQAQELQKMADERAAVQASVEAMRKDVEAMKAAQVAPSPAQTAPASTSDASAQADPAPTATIDQKADVLQPSESPDEIKYAPGWVVEAYPMECEYYNRINCQRTEDPSLGSFVTPASPLSMMAHLKNIQASNGVGYVAEGFFYAKSDGPHVFSIELLTYPEGTAKCQMALNIEGRTIISQNFEAEYNERLAKTASVHLQYGLYAMRAEVFCKSWKFNKKPHEVIFQIRRPGDAGLAPMGGEDILHLKK